MSSYRQHLYHIVTRTKNSMLTIKSENASQLYSYIGGIIRRYSLKELEKKLNLAEFKIVYSTYFFTVLPIPIFLFRTIPYWLGLNKKKKGVENHENDHKKKSGLISNLLNKVWENELTKIRKEKTMSFGGSCLVVARKINK